MARASLALKSLMSDTHDISHKNKPVCGWPIYILYIYTVRLPEDCMYVCYSANGTKLRSRCTLRTSESSDPPNRGPNCEHSSSKAASSDLLCSRPLKRPCMHAIWSHAANPSI